MKEGWHKGVKHGGEEDVRREHTSRRRLTPLGVEQAKATGAWLKKELGRDMGGPNEHFLFRLYVSPFVRALETAGNFGFGRDWRVDSRLFERDWGSLDDLSYKDRLAKYGDALTRRKERALFWRPGEDGETLYEVFDRLKDFAGTLHRQYENFHVIVVCHGEVIWAFRYLFEYWLPDQLSEAMLADDPHTELSNCRIVQYSRYDAKAEQIHLCRARFVNPMDPDNPECNRDWFPIGRPRRDYWDLLRMTEKYPRFLTGEVLTPTS